MFSLRCVCVFSPRLANHSRGHWSQDSLHHGQMFPVVMGLMGIWIQLELDNHHNIINIISHDLLTEGLKQIIRFNCCRFCCYIPHLLGDRAENNQGLIHARFTVGFPDTNGACHVHVNCMWPSILLHYLELSGLQIDPDLPCLKFWVRAEVSQQDAVVPETRWSPGSTQTGYSQCSIRHTGGSSQALKNENTLAITENIWRMYHVWITQNQWN